MLPAPENADSEFNVNIFKGSFEKKRLPDYMIPSYFIRLDKFPLTANNKVDRRALPMPEGLRPDLAADFVAPQTDAEERVAAIWREALHLEKAGIHDNFFDLGGTLAAYGSGQE